MHGPGSPPRGRGKVDGPPAQVGRGRITPAQAGRSPYFLYGKKDYKDHPRIGGEKAELTAAVISAMGSPPRRRGKGYREFGIDISDRITPAQAGKSVAPRQKRSALWDHPRVGGEKGTRRSHGMAVPGSPPRGRGKATGIEVPVSAERITPAWAGKRLKRSHRSGIFISGPIPFHSVLHRPAGSGGSRAGRDGSPAGQPQNTGPA